MATELRDGIPWRASRSLGYVDVSFPPSLPKLLEFRLSFKASPLEHAPELAEARLGGDDPPVAGLPKHKQEFTAGAAAA